MIRPTNFFLNLEATADNKFMNTSTLSPQQSTKKAQQEFDQLRQKLEQVQVKVLCYD